MKIPLLVTAALVVSVSAQAANVGNWSGSTRSWNSSDFSSMKAAALGAGHTVEADGAMDAGNLANDDVFIVGEGRVPNSAELSALANWVNAGGIALILNDSGCGGCAGSNAILDALGSTINVTTNSAMAAPFESGQFTTVPYDIVGQSLMTSPGMEVTGGMDVAGSFIKYEAIGGGYVVVCGDRSDHNFAAPSANNVNGQFFLNVLANEATDICDLGALAFARGCISGTATWDCDQNGDGQFRLLSDTVAYLRACRGPASDLAAAISDPTK
jgi:hypothetical protein